MQTFLPYADFAASAAVLDAKRLGKQRVEALQVLRSLRIPDYGWKHHPVVKMWRGHEAALAAYGLAIVREWTGRGHADTCEALILDEVLQLTGKAAPPPTQDALDAGQLPPWLGDEALHASHRAALIRKDPAYYRPRFRDADALDPDAPYVWPVS